MSETRMSHISHSNMDAASTSPERHAKLSQHSPTAEEYDVWSGDGSSGDEGNRSQTGASKRKRPLSVSCETCKQRKVSRFSFARMAFVSTELTKLQVKCDRGQPSCAWCSKNQSVCVGRAQEEYLIFPGLMISRSIYRARNQDYVQDTVESLNLV